MKISREEDDDDCELDNKNVNNLDLKCFMKKETLNMSVRAQ